MRKVLSYDDVLLVPKYSDITSRSQVTFRRVRLRNHAGRPIVGAPMILSSARTARQRHTGTFGVSPVLLN